MFILHKYFCIPMGVFSGYGEGLSGSINAGNFLTRFKVYWLASQEGLCSMELLSKYGSVQGMWSSYLSVCHVSMTFRSPAGLSPLSQRLTNCLYA